MPSPSMSTPTNPRFTYPKRSSSMSSSPTRPRDPLTPSLLPTFTAPSPILPSPLDPQSKTRSFHLPTGSKTAGFDDSITSDVTPDPRGLGMMDYRRRSRSQSYTSNRIEILRSTSPRDFSCPPLQSSIKRTSQQQLHRLPPFNPQPFTVPFPLPQPRREGTTKKVHRKSKSVPSLVGSETTLRISWPINREENGSIHQRYSNGTVLSVRTGRRSGVGTVTARAGGASGEETDDPFASADTSAASSPGLSGSSNAFGSFVFNTSSAGSHSGSETGGGEPDSSRSGLVVVPISDLKSGWDKEEPEGNYSKSIDGIRNSLGAGIGKAFRKVKGKWGVKFLVALCAACFLLLVVGVTTGLLIRRRSFLATSTLSNPSSSPVLVSSSLISATHLHSATSPTSSLTLAIPISLPSLPPILPIELITTYNYVVASTPTSAIITYTLPTSGVRTRANGQLEFSEGVRVPDPNGVETMFKDTTIRFRIKPTPTSGAAGGGGSGP